MLIFAFLWTPVLKPESGHRWSAFGASLLLHALVTIVLVGLDLDSPAESSKAYQVTMLPKSDVEQTRVLWYDFRRALPNVSPVRPFGPADRPQAERLAIGPTVVAESPQAASKSQVIWQPQQRNHIPDDIPAPNLVAVREVPAAPIAKPAPRRFVPPPASPRGAVATPAIDAPEIEANGSTPLSDLRMLEDRPRLKAPTRKLVMPTGAPARSAAELEPPPPDTSATAATGGSSLRDLRAAIIGLNPTDKLAAPPPDGSRTGQFSQAAHLGTPSSGPNSQPGAPTVPGVVALGGAAGSAGTSAPAAAAAAAVPGRRVLREIAFPPFGRTLSAPLRPAARVIPSTVEAAFANRNVFTILIPAPALPCYDGDWVLWFSGRQPGDALAVRITAPVPARKFALEGDPADELEGSGTLQLAAVIDQKGRVSAVRILRGPSAEGLRRKATEELQSWVFQPALRNTEPIDVDIVVEIPFQFDQRAQRPSR